MNHLGTQCNPFFFFFLTNDKRTHLIYNKVKDQGRVCVEAVLTRWNFPTGPASWEGRLRGTKVTVDI